MCKAKHWENSGNEEFHAVCHYSDQNGAEYSILDYDNWHTFLKIIL
jgi:hypothetical protein